MIRSDRRTVVLTMTRRGQAEAEMLRNSLEDNGYKVSITYSAAGITLDAKRFYPTGNIEEEN